MGPAELPGSWLRRPPARDASQCLQMVSPSLGRSPTAPPRSAFDAWPQDLPRPGRTASRGSSPFRARTFVAARGPFPPSRRAFRWARPLAMATAWADPFEPGAGSQSQFPLHVTGRALPAGMVAVTSQNMGTMPTMRRPPVGRPPLRDQGIVAARRCAGQPTRVGKPVSATPEINARPPSRSRSVGCGLVRAMTAACAPKAETPEAKSLAAATIPAVPLAVVGAGWSPGRGPLGPYPGLARRQAATATARLSFKPRFGLPTPHPKAVSASEIARTERPALPDFRHTKRVAGCFSGGAPGDGPHRPWQRCRKVAA